MNSAENIAERFFSFKAACLLHDPPNKAWKLAAHESEAERLASDLERETSLRIVDELKNIGEADKLAASIDRWILDEVLEDIHSHYVKKVRLKNIFDPSDEPDKMIELPQQFDLPESLYKELKELLRGLHDPLAYHTLYAFLEASWIKAGVPSSPADTRVPTHTVADHLYATASIANWVMKKNKGFLISVGIKGIQPFISASRKLSDLWISSYLVSAISWSVAWFFVKHFGPDVLLMPTCRHNPFYYHSLYYWVMDDLKGRSSKEQLERFKKKFGELSKFYAGYDPSRGPPEQPVMPGDFLLILPPLDVMKDVLRRWANGNDEDVKDFLERVKDEADLEKFVERLIVNKWKKVYSAVWEKGIPEGIENLDEVLVHLVEVMKEAESYGFKDVPPFPILVCALPINKVAEKLERYAKEKESGGCREKNWSKYLYHDAFNYLGWLMKRKGGKRHGPEAFLKLTEMTSQWFKTWPKSSGKGYDYCTVCGKFPAVVVMPSDHKTETGETDYAQELKKVMENPKELEPVLSPGERLCPYCLTKRLILYHPFFERVVKELLGGEVKLRRKFPSVADVANSKFKAELARRVAEGEIRNKVDKILGELLAGANRLGEGFDEETEHRLTLLQKAWDEIRSSKNVEKELLSLIRLLLFAETESTLLKTEKRAKVRELLKNLRMEERPPYIYYAIVRADGDNMGKLISGRNSYSLADYVEKALEGGAKERFLELLKGSDERAECIKERLEMFKDSIVLTPTYHAALSRALMRAALRDVKKVNEVGGFVVFAGGDDLLAIVPVEETFRTVSELRKAFSNPDGAYPFERPWSENKNYYLPTISVRGKSFSVTVVHYLYPMYGALKVAHERLDEVAKESEWKIGKREEKKDAVVFSQMDSGEDSLIRLKLTDERIGDLLDQLAKICELIDEEVLSSSLIYDLLESGDLLKCLVKDESENNEEILNRVLLNIFTRNMREGVDKKRKEEVVKLISEMVREWGSVTVEVSKDKKHDRVALMEAAKALKIRFSGMRGWSA